AVLAAAQTPQGDVDFIEIPSQVKNNLLAPEYSAALTLDRNFYAPNTTAQITLALHDNEGKAVTPAESRLYILRPDHTLLTSFAV
ncbi:hypothetical protein, partial [Enterococcus faecalis]|uniref:hypothetical protein n=1 Tax=Enterococcus faecalis TaxID=1351 RepID=UPI00403EFA4D